MFDPENGEKGRVKTPRLLHADFLIVVRLYGVHRLLPKHFAIISKTHDRPFLIEEILINFILIDFTAE